MLETWIEELSNNHADTHPLFVRQRRVAQEPILLGANPGTETASARLRQWDRSYDKQYSPTRQQFAEGGPRSDRHKFTYVILNESLLPRT